jgi:2-hydroxy-3-keto-5-methylthiopentenyl-1-phosphate phosphatase
LAAWSVLCDFDGTISTGDVTDLLLEAFGRPGWQELEAEWRAGRIGSRVCMQRQIACLDASKAELDEAIDAIGVDESFLAFVDAVRSHGWALSIVSDGLDYAIERILRRHHIPALPVYANRLTQVGERSWQLDSPHAKSACRPASGMCKCARAQLTQADGGKVLMIGDGQSDFCVAGAADFVFAKSRLISHCLDKSLPHAPISGFNDAIRLIPALVEFEPALSL